MTDKFDEETVEGIGALVLAMPINEADAMTANELFDFLDFYEDKKAVSKDLSYLHNVRNLAGRKNTKPIGTATVYAYWMTRKNKEKFIKSSISDERAMSVMMSKLYGQEVAPEHRETIVVTSEENTIQLTAEDTNKETLVVGGQQRIMDELSSGSLKTSISKGYQPKSSDEKLDETYLITPREEAEKQGKKFIEVPEREYIVNFEEKKSDDFNIIDVIVAIRMGIKDAGRRFKNGGCFQLYLVLKNLYPRAVAWDDHGHIYTEIDGVFYDIDGSTESISKEAYCIEHDKMAYAKAHDWDFE